MLLPALMGAAALVAVAQEPPRVLPVEAWKMPGTAQAAAGAASWRSPALLVGCKLSRPGGCQGDRPGRGGITIGTTIGTI